MKVSILFLLAFAAVVSSKEVRQDILDMFLPVILPFKERCILESNVDKEIADRYFTVYEAPENPEAKCFVKCLTQNKGWLRPDGTPIVDVIKNALKKLSGFDMEDVTTCLKEAEYGEDPCDLGYKFDMCMIDKFHV